MISAYHQSKFVLEFPEEDAMTFASLIKKVKERPAGYLRGNLTDEEQACLDKIYSFIDIPENDE
jgi:hypothetical protein